MNRINYNSRHEQAVALANKVGAELEQAIAHCGKASLAVPGGTTPAPFLQQLAVKPLAWSNVAITLTDERQVTMDNERSNAKLLQDNFLSEAAAAFQPLFNGDTREAVMQQTETQLREACLPLTSCVLGMGTDGHFASLFPAADQLKEGLDVDSDRALLVMTADNIPEPRLSLTLPALLSATHIHLLITGTEKLQVLNQAEQHEQQSEGTDDFLPIQALLRHGQDRLTLHYAD